MPLILTFFLMKVSKGAKIRNRYTDLPNFENPVDQDQMVSGEAI